jgi:hypothetical protein
MKLKAYFKSKKRTDSQCLWLGNSGARLYLFGGTEGVLGKIPVPRRFDPATMLLWNLA